MRKTRLLFFVLCFFIASSSVIIIAQGQEEASAKEENIAFTEEFWNNPAPWDERLIADEYVFPENWESAVEGVEEITFYNSGDMKFDIATQININIFEKATGIKVNAVPISPVNAKTKSLLTLVSKDSSVDAVLADDPRADLSPLAAGDWVTPVDHMYPDYVLKLYNPQAVDVFKYDGHWYGLPMTYIINLDFYRPSWFEKAGVEPPDNYVDLFEKLKIVNEWARENVSDKTYAFTFGGESAYWCWLQILYSQGAKAWENGKFHFLTEESKNAFKYLVDLVKEGVASEETLTMTGFDSADGFGRGLYGYGIVFGASFLNYYKNEYPDTVGEDMAAIPALKWDSDTSEDFRGAGTMANSNTLLINDVIEDNQKAAVMLFADYFRSAQALRYETVVESNDSMMSYVYETIDKQIELIDWELVNKTADQLQIERPESRTELLGAEARKKASESAFFSILPPDGKMIFDEFKYNLQKAALGDITVNDALDAIQQYADELF